MKRRLIALSLSLVVLLTGCTQYVPFCEKGTGPERNVLLRMIPITTTVNNVIIITWIADYEWQCDNGVPAQMIEVQE